MNIDYSDETVFALSLSVCNYVGILESEVGYKLNSSILGLTK